MTELAIRARDVSKVYRLYTKRHYRLLDFLGLLPDRPGTYTEHAALQQVNLEIGRGEKVALIGRNGAGKSTFLKLVTRVIPPTSGTLEVRGQVHALLQIGTGFHPDFTGRENVYSYLAQLGIVGVDARRKVSEIVEFAEIEEYVDQPAKTYSTGMSARLMFATSTAITPDVLVLDEILGVGDAYFTQKSFERIRELCSRNGTTVLLVTHDVYSALTIASRMIWIDQGRVLMDGPGTTVVRAYEDSIRAQEEHRLRVKKQRRLADLAANKGPASRPRLLVELYSPRRAPLASRLHLAALSLRDGERVVASLPLGADAFADAEGAHLEAEGSCWGDQGLWQGRSCRSMLDYGSPFHKVAGVLVMPADADLARLSIRVEYGSERPCEVELRCFVDGRALALGGLPPSENEWCAHEAALSESVAETAGFDVSTSGEQGSGRIRVTRVSLFDAQGREAHVLSHGDPATLVIDYEIKDPSLREYAQAMLVFHREGIPVVSCSTVSRDVLFDAALRSSGQLRCLLPRVALGPGAYSITVAIAREGYFDEEQTTFFSINPAVYCSLNRVLDIQVTGGGLIARNAVFVSDVQWSLVGEPVPATGAGS